MTTSGGFARLCVQIGITSPIGPGTNIRIKDKMALQELIYEELPNLWTLCEKLGRTSYINDCTTNHRLETSKFKPIYGSTIRAARDLALAAHSTESTKSSMAMAVSVAKPIGWAPL